MKPVFGGVETWLKFIRFGHSSFFSFDSTTWFQKRIFFDLVSVTQRWITGTEFHPQLQLKFMVDYDATSGFYLRAIASPQNSTQFIAIAGNSRTIPRNIIQIGIPNYNYHFYRYNIIIIIVFYILIFILNLFCQIVKVIIIIKIIINIINFIMSINLFICLKKIIVIWMEFFSL